MIYLPIRMKTLRCLFEDVELFLEDLSHCTLGKAAFCKYVVLVYLI